MRYRSKQLVEKVLPRLARSLYGQLQRYRAGKLDDNQFAKGFEKLLQKQYGWLAEHGVSEIQAALAVHGAVLVLSRPGLRAEAEELSKPLECIEYKAVRSAAQDLSQNYEIDESWAFRVLAGILARYGE